MKISDLQTTMRMERKIKSGKRKINENRSLNFLSPSIQPSLSRSWGEKIALEIGNEKGNFVVEYFCGTFVHFVSY